MSRQDRLGFTLVELLVVITIIGMLVALLVPAVIAARESARQTQCMDNQKELATAIFSFELSKKRYPGYLTRYPGNLKRNLWTWPMELFKGLGLTVMHERLLGDPDGPGGDELLNAEIKQFICPDDKLGAEGSLSYVANTGQLDPDPEPAKAYGIFQDLTVEGPMLRVNSSDIRDGADQTLLIAERGNNMDQMGGDDAAPRKWSTGTEESLGFYWVGEDGNVRNHIRSYHPDISVVTFCGRNQKKLSLDIEYLVYAMLMTPDGIKAGQPGVLKEGDY